MQPSRGKFVAKTFPKEEGYEEAELQKRISESINKLSRYRSKFLTRSESPLGYPALLFLQAAILIKGVNASGRSKDATLVSVPYYDFDKDGMLRVRLNTEEFSEDPKYREQRAFGQLGKTLVDTTVSAFACELAMKSICLSCKDGALRTHNLSKLYNDLPAESKRRVEEDWTNIAEVLRAEEERFGKRRYFQAMGSRQDVLDSLDGSRASRLSKAARVLLDEGEIVGLSATIEGKSTTSLAIVEDRRTGTEKTNLKVKLGENPPKRMYEEISPPSSRE